MLVVPVPGIGRRARRTPTLALDRAAVATLSLIVFPLVVWVVATLYFGGELGRLSDDYQLLRRNPVSGALQLPMFSNPEHAFFWRPAFLFVANNLITLAYGHEWIVHCSMALTHLGIATLVALLLRRAGAGVLAASSAALLYLVVPQAHEAVFWMSAMGTELSLATFLALALAGPRLARGGLRGALLGFALAFLIPCWNEQPAAALPALPLLWIALRPADQTVRRAARSVLPLTGACLAAAALYLALMVGTAPAGERGSANSIVGLAELGSALSKSATAAWRTSFGPIGRDFVIGGLVRAADEIHGVRAALTLVLLAASGAWFASRWRARDDRRVESAPRADRSRLAWLALFGLAVAALSLVPTVVIRNQPLSSRLCAVPAAGFALAAGTGLALLRGGWISLAAGSAVAAWTATLALAMVGHQALYRDVDRLNRSVVEQLAAALPEPVPHAVFVPLDARAWPGHTGRHTFDRGMPLAWYFTYALGPLTREVFRRADLRVTTMNPWLGPLDLSRSNSDRLALAQPQARLGGFPEPSFSIPLERAAPFLIAEDGSVQLVDEVWIERPDGRDLRLETRIPPGRLTTSFVDAARDGPRICALDGWRGTGLARDAFVPVVRARAYGCERHVLALGENWTRAELALPLDPSPLATLVVLRIALEEASGGGVLRARCALDSAPERTLAELELTLADLAAQRRWVPLVVALGPIGSGETLSLEIERSAEGDARVLVTPGIRGLPPARTSADPDSIAARRAPESR